MFSEEIISLFLKSATLKLVQRTGWAIAGVNSARNESVADHTWGTSLLGWLISLSLSESGEVIDTGKVMTMALLHDLSESQVSDIPRSAVRLGGRVMEDGKLAAEHAAIEAIFDSHGYILRYAKDLITEYDEQESLESRIVHGADILDMLLHAISLERNGVNPRLLGPFFESSEDKLSVLAIPLLNDLYSNIVVEHRKNLV